MRARITVSKLLILMVLLLSAVIAVLVNHHRSAAIPDAKGHDDPRVGEDLSGSAVLPQEYEVYSAAIARYFQARPQRSPHPPDEKLTLVQVSNLTLPNEYWGSKDVPADLQAGTIEDYLANNKSPSLLTDHFNLPAAPRLAGHVLVDGRELQDAMDNRGSDAWIKFFARTLPSSHPENEHMIVQFSRVGFNRDMDQALVFEIRYCGAVLSKGGYRFMVKDSGRWKLKASFGVFHNGC